MKGLHKGRIQWDDEDDDNENKKEGVLPDGKYDRNTHIEFCCRTDGYAAVPIYLPTDKPFILFSNAQRCQEVRDCLDFPQCMQPIFIHVRYAEAHPGPISRGSEVSM